MRLTTVLSGLAILALTVSTASAQATLYSGGGSNNHGGAVSSGSGGAVFNGGSQGGRGAVFNGGSSGGGGMVINAAPANSTGANGAAPDRPRSGNSTTQRRANYADTAVLRATSQRDQDEREDRLEDQREFRGHRRGNLRNHPIYYPFYPGYGYSSDTTDYGQQPQTTEQYPQPEAPAPTIFENRPGYTPPPIRSYQPSTSAPEYQATGKQNLSASEPQPITILVFRDGHEIEIGNYAIVGNTLYNLEGDYRTHKILLADLDLDKTVKVNEARGYQFRLPKQQGS